MKLLLDIGNSSVNWAMEDNLRFENEGAFSYQKDHIEHSLQENLSSLQTPTEILLANVAGQDVYTQLDNWVHQYWQRQIWQPRVSAQLNGLKNSYIDTQQLGLDRWLAMLAAWDKYQSALCIVDCGSALTIDSIDDGGNHMGGYIVPGIELMQQALIMNTARIKVSINKIASLEYANNTQAAINNGAFLATVSMIDRVVNNMQNVLHTPPTCIISGGMAELINPLLKEPFKYEPNLVLNGLLIAQKNST